MWGAVFVSCLGVALGGGPLMGDLYPRDLEPLPGPIAWGHKFMGGGAGEGDQALSPEGLYPNRQEVKTDAVLPAYCEPPNPCPPGHSSKNGCLEEFENTAEFSREWQGRQSCLCDEEHMFSCPGGKGGGRADPEILEQEAETEEALAFQDALDELLAKNAGLKALENHKQLVAKKFHAKRAGDGPR